jgi:hypothetical protein
LRDLDPDQDQEPHLAKNGIQIQKSGCRSHEIKTDLASSPSPLSWSFILSLALLTSLLDVNTYNRENKLSSKGTTIGNERKPEMKRRPENWKDEG